MSNANAKAVVVVNRIADVEEVTDVALDVVRKLRGGRMPPATANALCSAVRTVYGGVKTERLLMRDMKPAIPAKPGRKALPPAANKKRA